LVLLGFALLSCAGTSPAPRAETHPAEPAPAVARASASTSAPTPATLTGCRAQPSTVYGSEAVTFVLDASSAGPLDVELFDQRGRRVARELTTAPGAWQPRDLPSGDFSLRFGTNHAACWVTVNRELSRERAASKP
jgi:hypothetical protein